MRYPVRLASAVALLLALAAGDLSLALPVAPTQGHAAGANLGKAGAGRISVAPTPTLSPGAPPQPVGRRTRHTVTRRPQPPLRFHHGHAASVPGTGQSRLALAASNALALRPTPDMRVTLRAALLAAGTRALRHLASAPLSGRTRMKNHALDQSIIVTALDSDPFADTSSIDALLLHPGLDGKLSLGEVLTALNNTPSGSRRYIVTFNLPRGSVILFSSTMVISFAGLALDGDMDGDGLPDIVLSGPPGFSWLAITASDNVVRHLAVQNISLEGSGAFNNEVSGNYMGADVDGKVGQFIAGNAVQVQNGAHDNTIKGNLIGGLGSASYPAVRMADGVFRNIVRGNRIGVASDGSAITNTVAIYLGDGATQNTIGGDRVGTACVDPCNLVATSSGNAIVISGTATANNVVAGNFIGVNAAGAAALPNAMAGIVVRNGANHNTIGGTRAGLACDGPCNLISGNAGGGIILSDATTTANTVAGNYIGTDINGAAPIPNGGSDLYTNIAVLSQAAGNTIGGDKGGATSCAGPCNLIGGSSSDGVLISDPGTTETLVAGNFIGSTITGTAAVSNTYSGVDILGGATQNTVGGAHSAGVCDHTCNLLSGNGEGGVLLIDLGTDHNRVRGNFIGVASTGTTKLPNRLAGVGVAGGASDNMVGDTTRGTAACDGPCNVIGGNAQFGVDVQDAATTGTMILGNYIGSSADGASAVPNGVSGVLVTHGAVGTRIGSGVLENINPQPGGQAPVADLGRAVAETAAPLETALPLHSGRTLAADANQANGTLAAAGPVENDGEDLLKRQEWFLHQRTYPLTTIPTGALRRALVQRDALRGASHTGSGRVGTLADAAWTHVGNTLSQQTTKFGAAGGRVTSLVVSPLDPQTLYAGTAGGGVWKSTDGGTTWKATSDDQKSLSIGALAISPTAPDTIYAGTGEDNFSSDSYYGAGILRSTDGGVTWALIGTGLAGGTIGRLIVDPITPTILYTAVGPGAQGNQLGGGNQGGIYRSTDSAVTWSLVLGGTASCPNMAGFDLSLAATGSFETLYAATGTQEGATTGSAGSCAANTLWSSTTFGQTWSRLTSFDALNAAAGGRFGRIAVAVAPANSQVIYAAAARASIGLPDDGALQGVYESTDGGFDWTALPLPDDKNNSGTPANQYWYDFYVTVEPADPGKFYLGGVDIFRYAHGLLGGWTNLTKAYTGNPPLVHPDQHALSIAPDGSFYAGNDGGVYHGSLNLGGAVWTNVSDGMDAIQLYHASAPGGPQRLYRGAQDNGVSRYDGINAWAEVIAGDGGYSAVDPTNFSIAYGESQYGRMSRTTDDGATWTRVTDKSMVKQNPAKDSRVAFIAPFILDPTQPARLLMGTGRLWETTDAGASWRPTEPGDLATVTQPLGGTIHALALGPASAPCTHDTIYAGTSNGQIQVSTNGGVSWTNGLGVPPRTVTGIAVSPTNGQVAWATLSSFNVNTPGASGHVLRTTDGGRHWADVSGSLPDAPANGIVADAAGALYVATDVGVFQGATAPSATTVTWSTLNPGLPNVAVFSLVLRPNGDLYAATHGRGLWVMPVVTPPAASATPVAAPTCTPGPAASATPVTTATPPTTPRATACAGPCNVIAGNAKDGVLIEGAGTVDTRVQGNFIGMKTDGATALGNGLAGVRVASGAFTTLIGGPRDPGDCAGPCNLISGNYGAGVVVADTNTAGVTIQANDIHANGDIGIDLGDNGVTPNGDSSGTGGAPDARAGSRRLARLKMAAQPAVGGPNDAMNFPVAVTAHARGGVTLISGILRAIDPASARIDLYANTLPGRCGFTTSQHPGDGSSCGSDVWEHFGEGQTYLGSAAPDASGVFSLTVSGALPVPFVSALATNSNGDTSEVSPICGDPDGDGNPDSDGDGLCDDWEKYGVDVNGDGVPDLDLPGRHADPLHKDLFLEIDYMDGVGGANAPDPAALQDVTNAFATAPLTNPDGKPGITLHAEVGEPLPSVPALLFIARGPGNNDDFADLKLGDDGQGNPQPCLDSGVEGHFGTPDERASPDCPEIITARSLVYRYAIFGQGSVEQPGGSGIADVGGSDLLITLGDWTASQVATLGGRRAVEGGTLMHELGHTLGLCHGGPANQGAGALGCAAPAMQADYKPNYLSVMNHMFQTAAIVPARPLDFSRWALPALDETKLVEVNGIGGATPPAGLAVLWPASAFTYYQPNAHACQFAPASTNGSVDWNLNGILGGVPVQAGINDPPPADCTAANTDTLTGYDDWNNISYTFRDSGAYASGVHTPGGDGPEPTVSQAVAQAGLIDFDGDGHVNAADNCPAVANPGQADANGDGIGDTCALQSLDLGDGTAHGGSTATGVITLTQAAPAGAALLQLYSSAPGVASVPVSLTIAGGASNATFTIVTSLVTATTPVTITAYWGPALVRATLVIGGPAATATATPPNTPTPAGTLVVPTPKTLGQQYTVDASRDAALVPGVTDLKIHCSDPCAAVLPLPFTYRFYNKTYGAVYVTSRGELQFSGPPDLHTNIFSGLPANTRNAIFAYGAPLRTDLPGNGVFSSVQGTAPHRIITVEWRATSAFANSHANFEARLYEDQPRFDVIYGAMDDQGRNGTVGIQEEQGSSYTQYEFNTDGSLGPGLQLAFQLTGATPLPTPTATVQPLPFAEGQIVASLEGSDLWSGHVVRYDAQGGFIDLLDTGTESVQNGGACFDGQGNLYVANQVTGNMTKFDRNANRTTFPWGGVFTGGPQSCVVDAAGHVWVGEFGAALSSIREFEADGTLLQIVDLHVYYNSGQVWMDLAADQCTLYYEAQYGTIQRINACTTPSTVLSPLTTSLPDGLCSAFRIRPNGEALVACSHEVLRLNAAGTVLQTYTEDHISTVGAGVLDALALDPDGASFWVAENGLGNVFKVDIATGKTLTSFNAGSVVVSLAIYGEQSSARPTATPGALSTATPTPFPTLAAPAAPGIVEAWGDNSFGQEGSSDPSQRPVPVQIGALPTVVAIAAGDRHTMALAADGSVYTFGSNRGGQLGQGGAFDQASNPVRVLGLSHVVAMAAGQLHSLALTADGRVWAWGVNQQGQAANITITTSCSYFAYCTPRPTLIPGLKGIVAIAAGGDTGIALGRDGDVWAFGEGHRLPRHMPLTNVVAVAAGGHHYLALKSDGTVWAWGMVVTGEQNIYGQLGDGTKEARTDPVQVSGLTDVAAVAAGLRHSLALKNDGTVWAWGDNTNGQLGDGHGDFNVTSTTPVQVSGIAGVRAIAAGNSHSLALLADSTVRGWGYNAQNELGTGTASSISCGCITTPVAVSNLSGVGALAAGEMHSLAFIPLVTTPTIAPTETPTMTPTMTPTPTVTPSPPPTASATASLTETATATSSATETPTANATATLTDTATATGTAAALTATTTTLPSSPTPTGTPTLATPTQGTPETPVTLTPTTPTMVPTPATLTPLPTDSPTSTTTATSATTATDTPTETPSGTATQPPSAMPTLTDTPIVTQTPTPTATLRVSETPASTATPSLTSTLSATPSASETPAGTVAPTMITLVSPTAMVTPSPPAPPMTSTPQPTQTPIIAPTDTVTPAPTDTATVMPTGTLAAMPSPSGTPVSVPTLLAILAPTNTPIAAPIAPPTPAPSAPTPTLPPNPAATRTQTAVESPTPSTLTATDTAIPATTGPTSTPSPTQTWATDPATTVQPTLTTTAQPVNTVLENRTATATAAPLTAPPAPVTATMTRLADQATTTTATTTPLPHQRHVRPAPTYTAGPHVRPSATATPRVAGGQAAAPDKTPESTVITLAAAAATAQAARAHRPGRVAASTRHAGAEHPARLSRHAPAQRVVPGLPNTGMGDLPARHAGRSDPPRGSGFQILLFVLSLGLLLWFVALRQRGARP